MKYKFSVIEIKESHKCRHKHQVLNEFVFDELNKSLCKRNMKYFLSIYRDFNDDFEFVCPDKAVKFKVTLLNES